MPAGHPAPPCQFQSGQHVRKVSTHAAGQVETTMSKAPLTYISYEGNSWSVELAATGTNILVDPWLVDKLTFGGLEFIYAGSKRKSTAEAINVDDIAAQTDLILITMSIDDHCHRPTLQVLPKSLPVVASPSAAKVAREIGYQTVYELDHGQEISLMEGKISVKATEGALVGPPWSKRENGFVIEEKVPGGVSLYYEPHADYNPTSVASVGTVDVVVSPPCTQSLLGYDLVKGTSETIPLLKMLKPKVVIPLMNAEFDASGPLNSLIMETGGPEMLSNQLKQQKELQDIKICLPEAGKECPVRF